jgi:hypothetical protein
MRPLAIGFAFGLVFEFFFLEIGGGGHGLIFPLYAVSAPFSVVPAGMLFMPLLSALLAWLSVRRPRWFLLVMAVHVVSAIVLGLKTFLDERRDSYSSFPQVLLYFKWWIVGLGVLYVAGQVLLWRSFAKSSRRQLSST